MPGAGRRSRRLKQSTSLEESSDFSSVNPVDGDILIFDDTSGLYENSHLLTGNYTVAGQWQATDLVVTNDATINDALTVQGSTNLNAALAVIGATTLNSSVTIATTLGVTGATTLSDTLNVAGLLTGSAGFSVTGNSVLTGDLAVSGEVSVGTLVLTDLNLTGNAIVAGFLQVDGVSLLNDDVTVTGNLSAGAIAGSSISSGGLISGSAGLSLAGIKWSATGQNVTARLLGSTGTYSTTGIQTDLTVQTMLTLNPDAHHAFGGVDGLLLPVGTTAQEPTGEVGMIRYDSDTDKFMGFEGAAWVEIIGTSHTQSHAVTSTSDHTANNWKVLYSDGSGDIQELALPALGDVLTGGGVAAAPTWETPGAAHTRLHAMTDVLDHSATNWSIFHSNGAAEVVELALGTSGDVLTSGGTAAAPTWETPGGGSSLVNWIDNGTAGEGEFNGSKAVETWISGTGSGDMGGILVSDPNGQDQAAFVLKDDTVGSGGFVFAHWSDANVYADNRRTSGHVIFRATDNTGILLHSLFDGDPDGKFILYYDGIQGLDVDSAGTNFQRTTGATTVNRLRDASSANEYGTFSNTSGGYTYTYVHGGTNAMWAEDTGGTAKLLLDGTGDGTLNLRYAGDIKANTLSSGLAVLGVTYSQDNTGAATAVNSHMLNSEGGIKWVVDGDDFWLYQTDNVGAAEDIIMKHNNNGSLELYYNGLLNAEVISNGFAARNARTISFDGTNAATAITMYQLNSEGGVRHDVDGDTWTLTQTSNTGAAEDSIMKTVNNDALIFYFNGSEAARTMAGSLQFGTRTVIAAETITGYITIKDAGGTSRKLAIVS